MSETEKQAEPSSAADTDAPEVQKTGPDKKSFRYWLRILPGTKLDYFFILLAAADTLVLFIRSSYSGLISGKLNLYFFSVNPTLVIIGVDILVVIIWFFYLYARLRHAENKLAYLKTHWYEIVGMIPLPTAVLRIFLLLRAAKFAIAFYKLGRASRDVGEIETRDINFRFRDVFVDTIADAVFKQSLDRVEQVMERVDYSVLAHKSFDEHNEQLRQAIVEAIQSKSVFGELTRIPFMGAVTDRLGEELSDVVKEVLETEAAGNIIRGIILGVLAKMSERVSVLDVERITGKQIDLGDKSQKSAPAES